MRKLNTQRMENLQGGIAFSKAFTVNGQKLVIQGNCAKNNNGFINLKKSVFGLGGNGASILHLTGAMGGAWLFATPLFGAAGQLAFILDCTDSGSPDVFYTFI